MSISPEVHKIEPLKLKHDGAVELATGRSRYETSWRNREITWGQLLAKVSQTKRTKETGIQCKEINDKINTYRFMHSSPLLE